MMPTGACGINCDVCRLNSDGICSSCHELKTEKLVDKFDHYLPCAFECLI